MLINHSDSDSDKIALGTHLLNKMPIINFRWTFNDSNDTCDDSHDIQIIICLFQFCYVFNNIIWDVNVLDHSISDKGPHCFHYPSCKIQKMEFAYLKEITKTHFFQA